MHILWIFNILIPKALYLELSYCVWNHKWRIQKLIDDNVEMKPAAQKAKADVGTKIEHKKTKTEKPKASHKK
jgi:hypothetical protein